MHLSYYRALIFQFHNMESQTACLPHFGWHDRCIHMAASSQLGRTHPEKPPKLLSQTACKSALKWEQASARLLPVCLPAASPKKYGFMKFATNKRGRKKQSQADILCDYIVSAPKCCSDQNSPLCACVCSEKKTAVCVCVRETERETLFEAASSCALWSPKAVCLHTHRHTHTHMQTPWFSPLWYIDPLHSASMRCRQHPSTQTAHNHDITLGCIETCHRKA